LNRFFSTSMSKPASHLVLTGKTYLYEKLKRSRAVIVLYSASWRESRWCFAELSHARVLGRTVIPVCLDETPLEGFLATVQTVRRSAPDSTRRILDGLRTAGISSKRRFLPDPNRVPFPGLTSFQPKDSPVFFGRDDEVGRLLDRIALLTLVVDRRLILLAGPTGSGKSSLLLAGVIPRLEVESTTWSVCPPIRAGNYKARSLKAQIEGTAATQGTRTLVIPIDQVEEILTSASLTDNNSSLLDELADVFGRPIEDSMLSEFH